MTGKVTQGIGITQCNGYHSVGVSVMGITQCNGYPLGCVRNGYHSV